MGEAELPEDDQDRWRWIRNPLPPASEGIDFRNIRRTLKVSDEVVVVPGDSWNKLRNPDKDRIHRLTRFGLHHNPFIRHIVRRTRDYLETTIDPETNEPYLKPVKVKLYGETAQDAIPLPLYLRDAYAIAEEFCDLLGQRMKGSGFLRTLLLRRVGSTICAGMNTAKSMLGAWEEGKIEEAKQTINAVPQKHPFEFKYHQVKKVPWESCATVLSASDRR